MERQVIWEGRMELGAGMGVRQSVERFPETKQPGLDTQVGHMWPSLKDLFFPCTRLGLRC